MSPDGFSAQSTVSGVGLVESLNRTPVPLRVIDTSEVRKSSELGSNCVKVMDVFVQSVAGCAFADGARTAAIVINPPRSRYFKRIKVPSFYFMMRCPGARFVPELFQFFLSASASRQSEKAARAKAHIARLPGSGTTSRTSVGRVVRLPA